MLDGHGTSPVNNSDSDVRQSSKSSSAKPERERERECIEVKTVSPTHLRLTATTTKSAFCALHDLHENVTCCRRHCIARDIFVNLIMFRLLNV